MNNLSEFIMHSGGAVGSDFVWMKLGKYYGVKEFRHYYHGELTPFGNILISDEDFEEGKSEVYKANSVLERRPWKYMDLLARNWSQVKYSDSIFAIGYVDKSGTQVTGGTGWAVQMAINNKKPVFTYDQNDRQWFYYDYNCNMFREHHDEIVLTKNFAGIGTRGLLYSGGKAIQKVYEDTIEHLKSMAVSEGVKP